MSDKTCREAIIEGVSVPVGASEADVLQKASQKLKRSGLPHKGVTLRLYKKSVDARKREEIRLVYSVLATLPEGRSFDGEKLAAAGFNAELDTQPAVAIDTINALLGWVPMAIAVVMLAVVYFHPIEDEMAAMNAERG